MITLAGAEASATLGAIPKPKKPLKAMKMKRDPKKLRMGGGKVWEDHTLDDWEQGKHHHLCVFSALTDISFTQMILEYL